MTRLELALLVTLIAVAVLLLAGRALAKFAFDHVDRYDRRDKTAPPDERDA